MKKLLKILLKILCFPITWPFLVNKQIAKSSKNRFLHWLLASLIFSIAFFWLYIVVVVATWFLDGTITKETDMSAFKVPEIVSSMGIYIFLISFFLGFFSPWLPGAAGIHRERKRPKTHGDARFSTLNEVIAKGLLGAGIVFGRLKGKLIEKPSAAEGHVLVAGAPGTGKTAGVAIPTLFRFSGGAIVIDIKGELSALTAEHRKQFGPVFIFDPLNGGHGYDPIRECRTVDRAQNLARALVPTPEKADPMWSNNAQAILAAAVIEAAHTGGKLCEVAERLITTPAAQLIEELQESPVRSTRILSAVGADLPEKTLGGVMAQLKSGLFTLAADEGIAAATSRSDFTPESLEEGATIYLRVPEHLIKQYRELWTVMVSQFIRHLEQRQEKATPPVLMLLDEMPRLGELPGLSDSLATLRSRSVTVMSLIQSMAQLDEIYGSDKRKIIADTCAYKFVLSAGDPETQRYFADLAGQQTVYSKGITVGAGLVPNMSSNETGVHLVRPEAWARLPKPILMALGMQPTELDLAYWFKDKDFKDLAS
ncbi:type IV secretory system conjugative DNA transfer family protein [Paenibacillus chibensis]|uniref:type IV secretory system conjugative DNA transfer family protein n=1 Tax=Paenibacillus chibensis TaxID=59846 RepID=UPI000FD6E249|nr:type IV secretory system conjugative DNA transfer family protein [Paenibacillus chibensis]MEC0373328.1 type IV secretory system conjugative DNA transfer family protein [Paenibacillus chibensis]